jgi:hypothetical protein
LHHINANNQTTFRKQTTLSIIKQAKVPNQVSQQNTKKMQQAAYQRNPKLTNQLSLSKIIMEMPNQTLNKKLLNKRLQKSKIYKTINDSNYELCINNYIT